MFICTLHRCLYYGVNMKFASDEASSCKIQTRYKLKTLATLKVLSEVLFINFVFFSLLHAIVPEFPDIVVHDSYTVSRHFEKKCCAYWPASNNHLRFGLRRPIRLQEMLQSP